MYSCIWVCRNLILKLFGGGEEESIELRDEGGIELRDDGGNELRNT